MDALYHRQISQRALSEHVTPAALEAIVRANLAQDSIWKLLFRPEVHYDGSSFAAAERRLAALRERSAATERPAEMWAAFGALTHTLQDFYAHSNYVQLWLAARGGIERLPPEAIDPEDESILRRPELHSGDFKLWRDFIYYLPGQAFVRRRIPPPPRSHTAMNLDGPQAGSAFPYALAAAEKRTRREYEMLAELLRARGGEQRLGRFRGTR